MKNNVGDKNNDGEGSDDGGIGALATICLAPEAQADITTGVVIGASAAMGISTGNLLTPRTPRGLAELGDCS